MRTDGNPSDVEVATAIASGMVSPAPRAASSQRVSWVIGSGSTDASSMAPVWPPPGQARARAPPTPRILGATSTLAVGKAGKAGKRRHDIGDAISSRCV